MKNSNEDYEEVRLTQIELFQRLRVGQMFSFLDDNINNDFVLSLKTEEMMREIKGVKAHNIYSRFPKDIFSNAPQNIEYYCMCVNKGTKTDYPKILLNKHLLYVVDLHRFNTHIMNKYIFKIYE